MRPSLNRDGGLSPSIPTTRFSRHQRGTYSTDLLRRDRGSGRSVSLATLPGYVADTLPLAGGLIMLVDGPATGMEPWWSDGTAEGAYLLRDIGSQDGNSSPAHLVALGDLLLFGADDGVHGLGLWRSDGSAAGTVMLVPLGHAADGGVFNLFAASDRLYFGLFGECPCLWESDGSAAGTHRLDTPWDLGFAIAAGGTYYALGDDRSGAGLFRLDDDGAWHLVAAATDLWGPLFTVDDQIFALSYTLWRFGYGFLSPDTALGSFWQFSDVVAADHSLLLCDDWYRGLWTSDGTSIGTQPVQYLDRPSTRCNESYDEQQTGEFTRAGDHIFFDANASDQGRELWALPIDALPEICVEDCPGGPPPTEPPAPTPNADGRLRRALHVGGIGLGERRTRRAGQHRRRQTARRVGRRRHDHCCAAHRPGADDERRRRRLPGLGSIISRLLALAGGDPDAVVAHLRCQGAPRVADRRGRADLEFPNDLLRELDEMRFTIVETGEEIAARHRPVVLITSSNEKELPDAFLRRCILVDALGRFDQNCGKYPARWADLAPRYNQ